MSAQTELQRLQLIAFDETRAQLPLDKGILRCHGKTALIIPSDLRNSRLLREAGYTVDQVTSVEIKQTDFDNLAIDFIADIFLDGVKLRALDINNDKTDATVNITLGPRR